MCVNLARVDPGRILLVEDDPNDVELILLALENDNAIKRIDVVSDGVEALDYLLSEAPEAEAKDLPGLILLDLKLPRVDGITVLREIRENPRTRPLVVVVLTSSAEHQDIRICYNLGVNSYLVKPLEFEHFMDVAQQLGSYWMSFNQIPKIH